MCQSLSRPIAEYFTLVSFPSFLFQTEHLSSFVNSDLELDTYPGN